MIYGKLVFTLVLHLWCAHLIISDDLRPKHVAVVMNIIVFDHYMCCGGGGGCC